MALRCSSVGLNRVYLAAAAASVAHHRQAATSIPTTMIMMKQENHHAYCRTHRFSSVTTAHGSIDGRRRSTRSNTTSKRSKHLSNICSLLQRPVVEGWTSPEREEAQKILYLASLKDRKNYSAAKVNALWAVFERFVRETPPHVPKSSKQRPPHRVFTALLVHWKEAHLRPVSPRGRATEDTPVLHSPHDILNKVHQLSALLPSFEPSIFMYNVMATVDIKLAHRSVAPQVAEQWLARIHKALVDDNLTMYALSTKPRQHRRQSRMIPDVVTYNLVIQAWSWDPRPESAVRIEALVQEMQQRNIQWNTATCRCLLQFWANSGNVDKYLEILDKMRLVQSDNPDPDLLVCAITVLIRYGHSIRAEDCLQELLTHCSKGTQNQTRILDSIHQIMNVYRREFVSVSINQYQRSESLFCAEALVRRVQASGVVATTAMDGITETLMLMYALSGNAQKAHGIFTNAEKPDAIKYRLLIKAYINNGKIGEATRLVHQFLQDLNVIPRISMFTTLVKAWAVSSKSDAFDQAFDVLRIVKEHPRCVEMGIRPDKYFFAAMLKCLTASKTARAGEQAEVLLDEMEREAANSSGDYKTFEGPDDVTFRSAIKTCIEAGDLCRADAILKRMERSHIPPNTRTYNSILMAIARLGTSTGAERAEQIVKYMKYRSQTTSSSVEPNDYSYSIVLAGWSRSGDPNAADRMWSLYQQMLAESVAPSMASYSTLVSFFAKSRDKEVLAKADCVLQDMVERNEWGFQPDYRHFNPVLNGLLKVNDAVSATRTLVRYIEVYLCRSNTYTKPNWRYFSRVLKAWINAGDNVGATVFLENIQKLHDSQHLPEGPSRELYNILAKVHPHKNDYKSIGYQASLVHLKKATR